MVSCGGGAGACTAAQSNLGAAYYAGKGIGQDQREGVPRIRIAAEQGFAIAQYNLGLSYLNGEGVVKDYREAYIWLAIARARARASDPRVANLLVEFNWLNHLSQTEINSAQQAAARRMEAIESQL